MEIIAKLQGSVSYQKECSLGSTNTTRTGSDTFRTSLFGYLPRCFHLKRKCISGMSSAEDADTVASFRRIFAYPFDCATLQEAHTAVRTAHVFDQPIVKDSSPTYTAPCVRSNHGSCSVCRIMAGSAARRPAKPWMRALSQLSGVNSLSSPSVDDGDDAIRRAFFNTAPTVRYNSALCWHA